MITHIFFDLHGTLIDSSKPPPHYANRLGEIMVRRYGGDSAQWAQANLRIVDDWDSYYADLDFSGDDGIAHYYEGLFRTTRALFRLTNTPEPPFDELKTLSRQLPALALEGCNALFPEVKSVIESLFAVGYTLGITTHALTDQAQALLQGGGILVCFQGQIMGIDRLEKYERDENYFRELLLLTGLSPETCLIVDDLPQYLIAAQAVGMKTAHIRRKGAIVLESDYRLDQSLATLPQLLERSP